MPYIKEERRKELATSGHHPSNAGELNYELTRLLTSTVLSQTRLVFAVQVLVENYTRNNYLNYATINDIIGAVLGSLFEYFRRTGQQHPFESCVFQVVRDFYKDTAGPYEDIKINENGDVPGYVKGAQ